MKVVLPVLSRNLFGSHARVDRRPRSFRRWSMVLGVLGPLVLAACAGSKEAPRPCPAVSGVTGAQYLVRFDQSGQDLTDVLFEAEVKEMALRCEYDDNMLEADMRVSIEAVRGPADLERQASFNYFVAIATRDRKILAREEFRLEIPFPGNRTRVALIEEISHRIPLRAGQDGTDFIVYVGLALTSKELRYNLENR